MAQQVNPPRGMRDILPAEKRLRERAFRLIRQNYFNHGFDEIEAPALEDYRHLHSGVGGDNEKLSYSVLKRGITPEEFAAALAEQNPNALADLGLRYDLTVPLTRYYASNHAALPKVFRALQMGPVWRAERPQKGRYRQFVQCDIDIIGEPTVLAEIELITATLATLEALGIAGGRIRINDRRLLIAMLESFGFAAEVHAKVLITIDKLDKIGPDGVVAELLEWGADAVAVDAFKRFLMRPQTMEYRPFGEGQIRKVLPEGMPEEVIAGLVATGEGVAATLPESQRADPPIVFDPFLVRGMGYYTGQIFEIFHPDYGYSLGGGGRYDGMIGRFLNRDVPAVGFSIGFERIVESLALTDDEQDRHVAVLYEADVDPKVTMSAKATLLAEGVRVRLQSKPKKLAAALTALADEGFTEFLVIGSEATAEDFAHTVETKPLTR